VDQKGCGLIGKLRVTDSKAQVREWIEQDAEIGFDIIFLHQIADDWQIFSDLATDGNI
jgi:hypothetical protein